ncbi:MAG TPA: hypothetical protein VIF62_28025 [Labilithrix sp.]|jgi:hypothetical protein
MRQRTNSERLLQPIVLTSAALAIGALIGAVWGGMGVAMYALTLPVGLFLLWVSWDVATLEERLSPPETKVPALSDPKRAGPRTAAVVEV